MDVDTSLFRRFPILLIVKRILIADSKSITRYHMGVGWHSWQQCRITGYRRIDFVIVISSMYNIDIYGSIYIIIGMRLPTYAGIRLAYIVAKCIYNHRFIIILYHEVNRSVVVLTRSLFPEILTICPHSYLFYIGYIIQYSAVFNHVTTVPYSLT